MYCHDALVVAGELAQVVLVVRVGQEAHVEGEILLARRAVLEAEAHERERQAPDVLARQQLVGDAAAQHRGGHAGRVDHEVRARAQRLEQRALGGHAGGDAALGRERMAAAGLLVARGERLLGGLQEQHVVGDAERLQVLDHRCERLEVDASAHVGDNGGALDLGALVHEQLDQRADHLGRQIVDAEVAGVLEHVHRRGLAGAREARDDDEVLQTRHDGRSARRTGRHGPGGGHLQPIVAACAGGKAESRQTQPARCRQRVDVACRLGRQAGNPLQLLARGGEDRVGRAEVGEQGALARRADAGQTVEQRAGHRAVASACGGG